MKKYYSPLIFLLLLLSLTMFMLAGCAQSSGPADDSRLPAQTVSGDGGFTAQLPDDPADPASSAASTDTLAPTDAPAQPSKAVSAPADAAAGLTAKGAYTTKEDVALYIKQFGKLPQNFITKQEAQKLGWSGGSLEPYAPGKCIGGNRFGNYEGILPEKKGRYYTECDIDTLGAASRGAKRIVFSNDGLIYYTNDHYASFTLLYGDEKR
jgi:guanyl-specific ribonuclease Sa